MVDINFSELYKYSEENEETGERVFDEKRLRNEASPDVIKLYERYKELKDEEKRTGICLF